MIVRRIDKPRPSPDFSLTFSHHEGWAILAALNAWIGKHPDAADTNKWREWAKDLDRELRRDC